LLEVEALDRGVAGKFQFISCLTGKGLAAQEKRSKKTQRNHSRF
jgi:hypothetical protein